MQARAEWHVGFQLVLVSGQATGTAVTLTTFLLEVCSVPGLQGMQWTLLPLTKTTMEAGLFMEKLKMPPLLPLWGEFTWRTVCCGCVQCVIWVFELWAGWQDTCGSDTWTARHTGAKSAVWGSCRGRTMWDTWGPTLGWRTTPAPTVPRDISISVTSAGTRRSVHGLHQLQNDLELLQLLWKPVDCRFCWNSFIAASEVNRIFYRLPLLQMGM